MPYENVLVTSKYMNLIVSALQACAFFNTVGEQLQSYTPYLSAFYVFLTLYEITNLCSDLSSQVSLWELYY